MVGGRDGRHTRDRGHLGTGELPHNWHGPMTMPRREAVDVGGRERLTSGGGWCAGLRGGLGPTPTAPMQRAHGAPVSAARQAMWRAGRGLWRALGGLAGEIGRLRVKCTIGRAGAVRA